MKERGEGTWYLYVLACRDGSWYTGITKNLARRIEMHGKGTASKYTRSRLPVRMIYQEACGKRSDALKKEAWVKGMTREEKEEYVRTHGSGAD
jgi:UV DNA damage endonuclease